MGVPALSFRTRELLNLVTVGLLTAMGFASVYIGRSDLVSAESLVYGAFWLGLTIPYGIEPIVWMLGYFAVVGNITALQRFWSGWKQLA